MQYSNICILSYCVLLVFITDVNVSHLCEKCCINKVTLLTQTLGIIIQKCIVFYLHTIWRSNRDVRVTFTEYGLWDLTDPSAAVTLRSGTKNINNECSTTGSNSLYGTLTVNWAVGLFPSSARGGSFLLFTFNTVHTVKKTPKGNERAALLVNHACA